MLRIEVLCRRGGWRPWIVNDVPAMYRDRQGARAALLRLVVSGVPSVRATGDEGTELLACLEPDGSACVSVGVERVSAERLAQFREVAS